MAVHQNKFGSWKTTVILAVVGLGLLFFYSHFRSKRESTLQTMVHAASRMKTGWEMNIHNRTIAITSEIPPEYWPASVKDQKPVRIYILNHHIMIVQKESKGGESGLMVVSDLSSSRPDDRNPIYHRLNLRQIGRNVYRYRMYFQ